MRKAESKGGSHAAVAEPPQPEAPVAETLAECRRDLDAVATVAAQLITNANGQGEINRRLTERLLAVEHLPHGPADVLGRVQQRTVQVGHEQAVRRGVRARDVGHDSLHLPLIAEAGTRVKLQGNS